MSACSYCGRKCPGLACHAHADLPKIDPFYNPDRPQRQEPAERSLTRAVLNGLPTKGR